MGFKPKVYDGEGAEAKAQIGFVGFSEEEFQQYAERYKRSVVSERTSYKSQLSMHPDVIPLDLGDKDVPTTSHSDSARLMRLNHEGLDLDEIMKKHPCDCYVVKWDLLKAPLSEDKQRSNYDALTSNDPRLSPYRVVAWVNERLSAKTESYFENYMPDIDHHYGSVNPLWLRQKLDIASAMGREKPALKPVADSIISQGTVSEATEIKR